MCGFTVVLSCCFPREKHTTIDIEVKCVGRRPRFSPRENEVNRQHKSDSTIIDGGLHVDWNTPWAIDASTPQLLLAFSPNVTTTLVKYTQPLTVIDKSLFFQCRPRKRKHRRNKETLRSQTKRRHRPERTPSTSRTSKTSASEPKQKPTRLPSTIVVPETSQLVQRRPPSPIRYPRTTEKLRQPTHGVLSQFPHPIAELPIADPYRFTSERRVDIVPEPEPPGRTKRAEAAQEDIASDHLDAAKVDTPETRPPKANDNNPVRRAKRLSRSVRAAKNQTDYRKAWCSRHGYSRLTELITPKPGTEGKEDVTAFNEAVLRVAKAQYRTWYQRDPPGHIDIFAVDPPPPLPPSVPSHLPKEASQHCCCCVANHPRPSDLSPRPPDHPKTPLDYTQPTNHPLSREPLRPARRSRDREAATQRRPLRPIEIDPPVRRGPSPVDHRVAFKRTKEWIRANTTAENVGYPPTTAIQPPSPAVTNPVVDPAKVEPVTYGEYRFLAKLRADAKIQRSALNTVSPTNDIRKPQGTIRAPANGGRASPRTDTIHHRQYHHNHRFPINRQEIARPPQRTDAAPRPPLQRE